MKIADHLILIFFWRAPVTVGRLRPGFPRSTTNPFSIPSVSFTISAIFFLPNSNIYYYTPDASRLRQCMYTRMRTISFLHTVLYMKTLVSAQPGFSFLASPPSNTRDATTQSMEIPRANRACAAAISVHRSHHSWPKTPWNIIFLFRGITVGWRLLSGDLPREMRTKTLSLFVILRGSFLPFLHRPGNPLLSFLAKHIRVILLRPRRSFFAVFRRKKLPSKSVYHTGGPCWRLISWTRGLVVTRNKDTKIPAEGWWWGTEGPSYICNDKLHGTRYT